MKMIRWESIIAAILFCLLSAVVLAQDASDANASAVSGDSAVASEAQPTADPVEEATRIQSLGHAAWLRIRPGVYHVGPLYLNNVSFSQAFENYGKGDNTQSRTSSTLTANLFYTKQFLKHSRLAFQYAPNLYVVDGRVQPDFVHQQVNLTTAIPLSRRLTLLASDNFSFVGYQSPTTTPAVDHDPASGNYYLNDYLQSSRNALTNSFDVSLQYLMSNRWSLTFTPNFQRLYNSIGGTEVTTQAYGGKIGASYQLNARTTVGFGYSYLAHFYSERFSDTQYHTVDVSLNRTFGRGFTVYIAAAGTTQPLNGNNKLAFTPTVRLAKQFRKSSIFGVYTRTPRLTTIIHDGYSDQIAVGYSTSWTRKLSTTFSVARYGESASTTDNSSNYGTAQVNYALGPRFALFASFSKRRQSGDPSTVFIGNRNTVMFGVSWGPVEQPVDDER